MAAPGASNETPQRPGILRRLDKGTFLGLTLAFGCIVGGLVLENGSISDITQATAALIVLGGTFGAVLVGTPMHEVIAAIKDLRTILVSPIDDSQEILERLVAYASKARKSGLVSLEAEADNIDDPFLKKAVNLAVDGTDLSELRSMMELDMSLEEHRMLARAKVYESAGGYSPTIGIIGAVLGLIQVMKNLANIEEVGHGIAVAFVATVYGVGAANILFLPAASKIRSYAKRRMEIMELSLEGVSGIVEGMNPKMIRRKLESLAMVGGQPSTAKARKVRRVGGAPAAFASPAE